MCVGRESLETEIPGPFFGGRKWRRGVGLSRGREKGHVQGRAGVDGCPGGASARRLRGVGRSEAKSG